MFCSNKFQENDIKQHTSNLHDISIICCKIKFLPYIIMPRAGTCSMLCLVCEESDFCDKKFGENMIFFVDMMFTTKTNDLLTSCLSL